MKSAKLRVPLRLLPVLFVTLACAGCASAPPIVATPAACSSLIPDSWRKGVPGAPLPEGDIVGDWIAFANAEAAQLDKANGRTLDAIGIFERCEARDAAAVKRARARFLGIF